MHPEIPKVSTKKNNTKRYNRKQNRNTQPVVKLKWNTKNIE